MPTAQELLEIKEEIEEQDSELKKLEGRCEELMNRLKKEFSISSLGQAESECKNIQNEIDSLQEKYDKDFNKLKKEIESEEEDEG